MQGKEFAGRYRLINKLGEGGMGSVWRAEDLNLGSHVAIKLIDPSIAKSAEAIARFKREAQAAASLRSSHVVQVLDHGIADGVPFIAMELLEGESLAARLSRVHRLSPLKTAEILSQVARALQRAHDRGIIHRDLKPDNIFVVQEGDGEIAKVLDFGVAKRLGAPGTTSGVKTGTGVMLGTPYYMSPEQALAKPDVNHKADIWSFGIIAFECIAGKRPFERDSLPALFVSICQDPVPIPSSVAEVPLGFDAWFARTAARDVAARFDTVAEAATQLRLLCGAAPSDPAQLSLAHVAAEPVAALSRKFEETAPPSSLTIPGLHKATSKRLIVILGIAALVIATAVAFALRPQEVTSSPANSGGPPALPTALELSQPAPLPSVAAVVDTTAPPIVLNAKPVPSVTPQLAAGAHQPLSAKKSQTKDGTAPNKPAEKPKPRPTVDLGF